MALRPYFPTVKKSAHAVAVPARVMKGKSAIKRALFIDALINNQMYLIKLYLHGSNLEIIPNSLGDNILHLVALYGKPNTIIKIIDLLPIDKVRLFARSVDDAGSLPIDLLHGNANLSPQDIIKIKKKLYALKLYPEFKPVNQLLTKVEQDEILDKYYKQIAASTKLVTYFAYAYWLHDEVRMCLKYSSSHPASQEYKAGDLEKIAQAIAKMRADATAQYGPDKDANKQVDAKEALNSQYGNCYEHAIIAQRFLFDAGIPSTICYTRDDHVFLAIGLDPVKHAVHFEKWKHSKYGDVQVIKTWPKDVLIVDTWAGNVFLPEDIPEKLSDYRHEDVMGRINPIIVPYNPRYQKLIVAYSNHHLLKPAALPAPAPAALVVAPNATPSVAKKPVSAASAVPAALFVQQHKPAPGSIYKKAMSAYAAFRVTAAL